MRKAEPAGDLGVCQFTSRASDLVLLDPRHTSGTAPNPSPLRNFMQ